MATSCGKLVDKSVQNSADKTWNLNVDKSQNVEIVHLKNSFTHSLLIIAQVFQNIFTKFYTQIFGENNLLNLSFTHFAHSSTITTTKYIINKGRDF